MLNHEIVTFTDLMNFEQLPTKETILFIGLPLKITGGDGSPVRAVAVLDLLKKIIESLQSRIQKISGFVSLRGKNTSRRWPLNVNQLRRFHSMKA